MPQLNGLEAARRIREQTPGVKLVFLTMHNDPNLAAAALELGQVAFVLKHSAGSELMKAIGNVLAGKSYLTPKLKVDDWAEAKTRARQFGKELTERQCDIVQLYSEGRPRKEVAAMLNISEKTVEFHKHKIMEAFNLENNTELIYFALRRGLITIDPEPGPHTRTANTRH